MSLLRKILEFPGDVSLRSCYADHLDLLSSNPEHCELIRVQLELETYKWGQCNGYYCDENHGHVDCRGVTLRERQHLLLGQMNRWFGWPWPVRFNSENWTYHNLVGSTEEVALGWWGGFPERMNCSLRVWNMTSTPVLERMPLRLVKFPERVEAIVTTTRDANYIRIEGLDRPRILLVSQDGMSRRSWVRTILKRYWPRLDFDFQ